MRVWPVLLDSEPTFLGGLRGGVSLLGVPLGSHTVLGQLCSCLEKITPNAPIIVSSARNDAGYRRMVRAACPQARIIGARDELTDALAGFELSDALLILDPRCLPRRELEIAELIGRYAAGSWMCHYLVAFDTDVARTRERVSFDSAGEVRGVVRHYEPMTWSFIAGVAAAVVPVASGVLADGLIPSSLLELRRILTARGVPSRDVPIESGALDLTEEAGLLAANEQFIARAAPVNGPDHPSVPPLCVGDGHAIHPTARIVGPVVLHHDACIGEDATVLGPAVIGAGARIERGCVVAHATIGAECIVPAGTVVSDCVWFDSALHDFAMAIDRQALSYRDRLARIAIDTYRAAPEPPIGSRPMRLKRALDILFAALALLILSPILLVVAAIVPLDSSGPIFYGDEREGLRSRVFKCWKFRTMRVGAAAAQKDLKGSDQVDGPHFKMDRDPRVTRVGRILRTLNLDELPQLFNVLVGEMSLVGPRPSPFRENQVCVPWREARLSVRPGITGMWQVCRHDRSAGDFHQWIEYDLLYVQHMTFWLDLKILAATLLTLGGKAAHVPAKWLVGEAAVERAVAQAAQQTTRASSRTEQVLTT
jgi:lipopolysaccharide/colanic/teichoic acid biosynthesis glycosyltransferase